MSIGHHAPAAAGQAGRADRCDCRCAVRRSASKLAEVPSTAAAPSVQRRSSSLSLLERQTLKRMRTRLNYFHNPSNRRPATLV
jgi:hypothetical protein